MSGTALPIPVIETTNLILRAPREDESDKLMAGLGVTRNALALAEVDQ